MNKITQYIINVEIFRNITFDIIDLVEGSIRFIALTKLISVTVPYIFLLIFKIYFKNQQTFFYSSFCLSIKLQLDFKSFQQK